MYLEILLLVTTNIQEPFVPLSNISSYLWLVEATSLLGPFEDEEQLALVVHIHEHTWAWPKQVLGRVKLMMAAADCIILWSMYCIYYIYLYLFIYDLTITWLWLTIKVWLLHATVLYRWRCCKVFAEWFNKLCSSKVYHFLKNKQEPWHTHKNTKKLNKTFQTTTREVEKRRMQHQWINRFPWVSQLELTTTAPTNGWVYCNCPLARPGGKSACSASL